MLGLKFLTGRGRRCAVVADKLYICCYLSFAWTCFHHLMHLAEHKKVLLTTTLERRKQEMETVR